MRLVLIMLMGCAAMAAFAAPGYLTSMELSHDDGNIIAQWRYNTGSDAYAAVQFDLPSGGPWYLNGIKYYVWPWGSYQGYGVACWSFEGGLPSTIVWPLDGNPVYNPNTGGYWIIQPVEPTFNLSLNCPQGFLVGIEFMYAYGDYFGVDNTGHGPYDWSYYSGVWGQAPYGRGSARALINDMGNPGVETTTIGQIRALYR